MLQSVANIARDGVWQREEVSDDAEWEIERGEDSEPLERTSWARSLPLASGDDEVGGRNCVLESDHIEPISATHFAAIISFAQSAHIGDGSASTYQGDEQQQSEDGITHRASLPFGAIQ